MAEELFPFILGDAALYKKARRLLIQQKPEAGESFLVPLSDAPHAPTLAYVIAHKDAYETRAQASFCAFDPDKALRKESQDNACYFNITHKTPRGILRDQVGQFLDEPATVLTNCALLSFLLASPKMTTWAQITTGLTYLLTYFVATQINAGAFKPLIKIGAALGAGALFTCVALPTSSFLSHEYHKSRLVNAANTALDTMCLSHGASQPVGANGTLQITDIMDITRTGQDGRPHETHMPQGRLDAPVPGFWQEKPSGTLVVQLDGAERPGAYNPLTGSCPKKTLADVPR